jgi:uncharacterized protein YjbI with pentapeptide repeats
MSTEGWSRATALVTAVTALGALVFTALSFSVTREQIAATEQGQITDRYAKAIDQIGTPGTANVWARVGGIFALERVARDSPRDRKPIVEVLSSFIHGTSPRPTPSATCPKVAADVAAAFLVLTRGAVGRERTHQFTDLRQTCLAGVRADDGADLSRMSFIGSDLHDAQLARAHGNLITLQRTNLTGAILYQADLRSYVFLDGANLSQASLAETKLSGGLLSKVRLTGADLTGADFSNVRLTGVDLTGAHHDKGTVTTGTTYDATTTGAWW